MGAPPTLALDLGGTRVRAAVVDGEGRIGGRAEAPTKAREGADAVVEQLAALAFEALGARPPEAVGALGLCAPGPLDTGAGLALATPTIRGFTDFPLRDRLAALVPWSVRLAHDGHAAAHGEWRFGAGRGSRDMVYVTVSTGIGAGAIVDGRPHEGHRGMAAHAGHMVIDPDGPRCVCGNRGCWEAFASGSAFAARAREAGYADGAAAFVAAREGDPGARALVDTLARYLGIGLVNLTHIFSPEVIVMGGGVLAGFDLLERPILRHVSGAAMPPFRSVVIRKAALGDNSGLAGVAALAQRALA